MLFAHYTLVRTVKLIPACQDFVYKNVFSWVWICRITVGIYCTDSILRVCIARSDLSRSLHKQCISFNSSAISGSATTGGWTHGQ